MIITLLNIINYIFCDRSNYGIMLDAGSTGTYFDFNFYRRAHLYNWENSRYGELPRILECQTQENGKLRSVTYKKDIALNDITINEIEPYFDGN